MTDHPNTSAPDLSVRLGEVIEENNRLRDQFARWEAVRKVSEDEDNPAHVAVRASFVRDMAGMFAGWFKDCGGRNYVEVTLRTHDLGDLVLRVQRKDGKTPNQLQKEAEARADAYRQVLQSQGKLEVADLAADLAESREMAGRLESALAEANAWIAAVQAAMAEEGETGG